MKMRRTIPFAEVLIGFFIIDCVNTLFFPSAPAFSGWVISPYWIIILLSASRYGVWLGFFSGGLAAVHVGRTLFHGIPNKSEISKLLESDGLVLPAAFIFTGLILGELREKYKIQEADTRRQLIEKEQMFRLVQEKAKESEKAYRLLEKRIVGETATVKMLYEAAQHFERLEADKIYSGCLEILTQHLQVEKSSIYLLDGAYFVLAKSHGWGAGEMAEAKIPRQGTLMDLAVQKGKLVTVRDSLQNNSRGHKTQEDEGVLASVPLRGASREIVGVVNIGKIDFLAFNEANLDLFSLVADWTSQVLSKAADYQRSQNSQIFDKNFEILSASYFDFIFPREFKKAKRFNLKLSVAGIKLDRFGFFSETTKDLLSRGLVAFLKRHLPETAMLFGYRFEGSFLLLAPMQTQDDLTRHLKQITDLFLQDMKQALPDTAPGVRYFAAEESSEVLDAQTLLQSVLKKTGLVIE